MFLEENDPISFLLNTAEANAQVAMQNKIAEQQHQIAEQQYWATVRADDRFNTALMEAIS